MAEEAEKPDQLKEKLADIEKVVGQIKERMGEGTGGDAGECVFCKIVKGELPSTKVFDDKNFIGILDINPKAEGHTVIICKNHYQTILDMPNTLGNELMAAIKSISLKLLQEKKAEGLNLFVNIGEVAGQTVPHVHVHIIPRKPGDGLKAVA
jgi:histidine triad (HIT) family protein